MSWRKYMLGLLAVMLITSSVIPVFSGSGEDLSASSSIAPFEEFYEPDEEWEIPLGDIYTHTFNYTYDMQYDVVPENLVTILDGTSSSYQSYSLTVNRPDDNDIRLIDQRVDEAEVINESISIQHRMSASYNIYDTMRSILRREVEDFDEPGWRHMADTTEVLFGEINEDLLVDPEPLKGEYEFTVRITGEDIEMNYGEDNTKLSVLSKPASEPRDLEGKYEDEEVRLEWDEPEQKRGSEIMQYDIYRATALYGYHYIGNVSGDQTEFVDEFGQKSVYQEGIHQREVKEGDVLYYRVVAINEDDYYYQFYEAGKRNYYSRSERMSSKEIVHLPYEETESSDMSYKWIMDYSRLMSEDNFEERLGMDSVDINEMEGGDLFLYDIERSDEENDKTIFEYEGGFYSQGEVDMVVEDDKINSELKINVDESWVDFSGKIWAEYISDTENEGFSITKQTITSEGKVDVELDNSFEFVFDDNKRNGDVFEDLDMEWEIDLTIDYEDGIPWVVSDEDTSEGHANTKIDYTGHINSEARFNRQSDHLDEEKITENETSKEISGGGFLGGTTSEGRSRSFSPIVGASSVGSTLTMNETLNESIGNIESDHDPVLFAFNTNCERHVASAEELYEFQYIDPMTQPGIGSFLGIELKRSHLTDQDRYLRSRILEIAQGRFREMENVTDPQETYENLVDNATDEMLKKTVVENPWGIHQDNGIHRRDFFTYGGIVIEPLGYFASEPLGEDELEDYYDDREAFFEEQIAEDDDEGLLSGYTLVILSISLLMSVLIYKKVKTEDH